MDRALYLSMTGASQAMQAQTIHANNLANASTTGFQADLAQARSMAVYGPGMPSRVYSMTENPGTDFTRGPLQQTGNSLDMAVKGEGYIAVLAPDGSEAYTRAGDLQLGVFGELLTGSGLPVLGNNGPVVLPPHENVEFGADGTVSVRELGQGAQVLAAIDRIKLVNPQPQELVKGTDGLMRRVDGGETPADAQVELASGYLEGSNVNVVDSMVEMISLARNYEMNVKFMQTVQQNSESSARLLQIQ
ncbi:flagellar basal-body rod protein FlgF [Pseudohongiella sp. SYSU M77423]|uniref:flagellar basal-body rod protein FlgF n=1 Tax=Pseudohongiella sp. SYSU M77423 TaxID=3042312 RepID=UPI0024813B0F|nr:flagellar basal-body rod protein FlgF [Pseudohongiella sp. SYSU M77423]MDH7944878.1 flagellar basal-body rod protein FlgF [Pseudohongiella sp. SYSU M77423]